MARFLTPTSSLEPWTRLGGAGFVMLVVVLVGAGGYDTLGGSRWTAVECLYMAVITISTVGYGETLAGLHEVPYARAWTIILIVLGSGSMLYFASSLTALIVEGDLGGAMRRRRMQRQIDELSGHLILCGTGTTGRYVLEGLARSGQDLVLVDVDTAHLEHCRRSYDRKLFLVSGDATDDAVLRQAGIERAAGVVLALTEDRDNVYAAIAARSLNPRLRIVAKAVEPGAADKLRRAGADDVVSPSRLGGERLASQLLRPSVMDFFNRVILGHEHGVGFEEVLVPAGGPLVGRSLGELHLREQVDVLVVGIRPPGGEWVPRPGAETRLVGGARLVVMGEASQVARLRTLLEARG